jgi:hypothetical protein
MNTSVIITGKNIETILIKKVKMNVRFAAFGFITQRHITLANNDNDIKVKKHNILTG